MNLCHVCSHVWGGRIEGFKDQRTRRPAFWRPTERSIAWPQGRRCPRPASGPLLPRLNPHCPYDFRSWREGAPTYSHACRLLPSALQSVSGSTRNHGSALIRPPANETWCELSSNTFLAECCRPGCQPACVAPFVTNGGISLCLFAQPVRRAAVGSLRIGRILVHSEGRPQKLFLPAKVANKSRNTAMIKTNV